MANCMATAPTWAGNALQEESLTLLLPEPKSMDQRNVWKEQNRGADPWQVQEEKQVENCNEKQP